MNNIINYNYIHFNMQENLKQDLLALKKRQIKLIFFIGPTGVGKTTQAVKLENELKYVHISTGWLIEKEIQHNTKTGQLCKEYLNKGLLVPEEYVLNLLIKKLVNTSGKIFLVDGFPRTLEQALFIEQNLIEISTLISYTADEGVLKNRIMSQHKGNILEDKVDTLITEYLKHSKNLLEFYNRFGVVRAVEASGSVIDVNKKTKEALLPEIYCIIGKKYSGKTTISNALCERMKFKPINFEKFLSCPSNKSRINDDEFIISKFIESLKSETSSKVIIEGFPTKESYYKLFVNNGKEIKKIFYLQTEDSIINERMMSLGKDNEAYIGSAKLKTELDKFTNENPINFLKNTNLIQEFNINNYFHLDFENLLDSIKPYIVMIDGEECELKTQLRNRFIQEEGYSVVDVSQNKLIIFRLIKQFKKL